MRPAPRSGRLISGLRMQSPAPFPAHRAQSLPVTRSPTGPPQEAAPSSQDCSPALGNTGNAGLAAQKGRPGHQGRREENEAACRGEMLGPRDHHRFSPGHSKVLPRPQARIGQPATGRGYLWGYVDGPDSCWEALPSWVISPSSSSAEATECLLSTQALRLLSSSSARAQSASSLQEPA